MTALNTGHRGSFATIHANTPAEVPARLAALGALAGMEARATDLQAKAAFQIVVHMERVAHGPKRGTRQLTQIGIFGMENGVLACTCAYRCDRRGRGTPGPAWEGLRALLTEDP